MFEKIFGIINNITPESTQKWTLALIPAFVVIGVAFLLATKRDISPEIVALLIGLFTAAILKSAIRDESSKNGDNRDYPSTGSAGGRVSGPSIQELEEGDRGGPHNSSRWGFGVNGHRWLAMGSLCHQQ